jgi:hypothetical protein
METCPSAAFAHHRQDPIVRASSAGSAEPFTSRPRPRLIAPINRMARNAPFPSPHHMRPFFVGSPPLAAGHRTSGARLLRMQQSCPLVRQSPPITTGRRPAMLASARARRSASTIGCRRGQHLRDVGPAPLFRLNQTNSFQPTRQSAEPRPAPRLFSRPASADSVKVSLTAGLASRSPCRPPGRASPARSQAGLGPETAPITNDQAPAIFGIYLRL